MMNSLALNYILSLLARRDYSAFEIWQKMQQKSFSEIEIESVLLHCQQKGWQSDVRFCESFIRTRVQRGVGPLRLRQELQQKGIDNTTIIQVMDDVDINWSQVAENVFYKKFPHYDAGDIKEQQKIWRFMASRGFLPDHFSDLLAHNDHFD